jgi:hypothetical protein
MTNEVFDSSSVRAIGRQDYPILPLGMERTLLPADWNVARMQRIDRPV